VTSQVAQGAPLPDYTTSFTAADFSQWMTVLSTVVAKFKPTLTFNQLAVLGS
jgi:hypothetical protein